VGWLKIRNWDRWQSYRKDRNPPPWIKLHRQLMQNVEWVSLSDSQRGQLVAIWLLAGCHGGVIPASASAIRKLCFMDDEPDLELFISKGFIDGCQVDAKLTPTGCQDDAPETETETETEQKRDRDRDRQEQTVPFFSVLSVEDLSKKSKVFEWVESNLPHASQEQREYILACSVRARAVGKSPVKLFYNLVKTGMTDGEWRVNADDIAAATGRKAT
jgi:hypothetical protein